LCLAPDVYAARQESVGQTQPATSGGSKARLDKTSRKKTGEPQKRQAAQEKRASVYDKQPVIADKELERFLEILPQFRDWCRKNNENPRPVVRDDKADFAYSKQAADWVNARAWRPERFFCVMGRLATALIIVEEGNDMAERSRDMPDVPNEDIELTRRHLGSILKALDADGSNTPPISR
jgi:hypothetical protein